MELRLVKETKEKILQLLFQERIINKDFIGTVRLEINRTRNMGLKVLDSKAKKQSPRE